MMLQDTQPVKTPRRTELEKTQPILTTPSDLQASQETQELVTQRDSTALPEWILDWARNTAETTPESPAPASDYTQENAFVAPPQPEESGWALAQEITADPMQSLEALILDGKFNDAKNFIVQHKDDFNFCKSANIAIRKHLSIEEAFSPLWEAYEILKSD
ncbi:MAG: hypothetical protein GX884_05870 [Chloroflexi bacterium]|nr:hypothetical protein [Chloroflexota bacterium]